MEGASGDCPVQPLCSKQGHAEQVAQDLVRLSPGMDTYITNVMTYVMIKENFFFLFDTKVMKEQCKLFFLNKEAPYWERS